MLAKLFATASAAALLLACAPASADTPTVAVVGVNTGSQPQNVDILDRSATWVPFGTLNSTTHTWVPIVSAAGSSNQLQFNSSGVFGGASGLTWNSGTSVFTLPDATTWGTGGLSALTVTGGGHFGSTVQSTLSSGVAYSIYANVYGQIGIDPVSGRGGPPCLGFSSSSPTALGQCVFDWTAGGYGSSSSATATVYGNLTLKDNAGNTVISEYLGGTGADVVNILGDSTALDVGASGAVGFCHDHAALSGVSSMEVTSGACGNANGSLKASVFSAPTLTATSALNLPDTGSATSNGITTGGNTNSGGLVVIAGSDSTLPSWTPTANGAGRIGSSATGIVIGGDGSGTSYYGYPGFVVQGHGGEEDDGCTGFCAVNDLSFMDSEGNVIAGIEKPVSTAPFPFTIGFQKSVVAATPADEGAPGLVQLFLSDVMAAGTVAAPYIIWQPGDSQLSVDPGPAFVGIGPESPTNHNIRVGTSGNEISPWADGSNTLDMDISGCWGVGIQNGSGTPWSGGSGMTWNGKLCASGAGGVEVMNGAKSADAPVKALFYRQTPTTVAGLSTADPAPADGDTAYVTDATACTINGALGGGGSTHCPVHYDGSSSTWKGGG